MRKRIPDLAIRTTFMVGFPGESEEAFEELCKFVKEIKFDKMGCFTYSPEEDTPAYDFDNQIEEDIKSKRAEIIMDIQYGVTEELNKQKIGKTYKAVIDEFDGEKYIARAYFDSPEIDSGIIINSDKELQIGEFVNIRITSFDGYDLIGEIV